MNRKILGVVREFGKNFHFEYFENCGVIVEFDSFVIVFLFIYV